MTSTLQIGVIGVGYLGQHHARIFSGLPGVTLVGVADLDACRAEDIARKHGCESCGDYRSLIERCDAVSIVTPTTTHHAIALECIEAGKDLFIEKPVTERADEAREIISRAAAQGLILQVGHIERFNPAVIALRGMIGRPRFLEAARLSPFLGRATDVDVTLDLMIHDIDIILDLVRSDITEIRAAGSSILTGKIDAASAWIEFADGTKAVVTASRLATEKMRTLCIRQDDAVFTVDYQSLEISLQKRSGAGLAHEVVKPEQHEPLKAELEEFVACVRTRTRPRVGGEEALAALETVLRINSMITA